MYRSISILVLLSLSSGVLANQNKANLSEQDVLNYATTPFNEVPENYVVFGSLNGSQVVVEFKCSDVCPDYTVRIVRYELNKNQSCDEVGGIEKEIVVPIGIAATRNTYCFPKVIADNWSKYQSKLSYVQNGVGPHN